MRDREHGPVLSRRRGDVVEIVLNRPASRNALTLELMTGPELVEHLAEAGAGDAQAVVLRGANGFFCSGVDTREVDPSQGVLPAWVDAHRSLAALTVPVVACLEGGAINAGAALVLASDVVVSARSGYLQVMEATMGVPAPMNAAWLAAKFPASVGLQLALSCRPFAGPELLRLGIALDVVADGEAVEHAARLAARLASYPRSAARSTKALLRRAAGDNHGFATAVSAALASVDGPDTRVVP